jgi:hypothetical protein
VSPAATASHLVKTARVWAVSARRLRRLGCDIGYHRGQIDARLMAARFALGTESAKDRNRRLKWKAENAVRSTLVMPDGERPEVVR